MVPTRWDSTRPPQIESSWWPTHLIEDAIYLMVISNSSYMIFRHNYTHLSEEPANHRLRGCIRATIVKEKETALFNQAR